MARKTFFSFHYERDVWRAGQVRNCNLLPTEDQYGFIDSVDWESIRRQGDAAIKRWICDQLKNTSVSAVLIGSETARRPWVQHEIVESWNRGNGIVGVCIHNIKDQDRKTDAPGANPFDQFRLPDNSLLSAVCKTHDWVIDDGRNNLGKWIEEAFNVRAKYAADDKVVEVTETDHRAEKSYLVCGASASAGFAPRSPWCPEYADT
jgi:antiphage defense system Thoeris ThsB-like protein